MRVMFPQAPRPGRARPTREQGHHESSEDMMTNATTHRQYHPERPPLLGLAAIVATAATLGFAVLLPAQHAPYAPLAAAQPAAAQLAVAPAPTQIVTLPPVEVIGTRATKAARNDRWNVPAIFRKNG
jgi:hypothetical protein